jgi:hypothetical protein
MAREGDARVAAPRAKALRNNLRTSAPVPGWEKRQRGVLHRTVSKLTDRLCFPLADATKRRCPRRRIHRKRRGEVPAASLRMGHAEPIEGLAMLWDGAQNPLIPACRSYSFMLIGDEWIGSNNRVDVFNPARHELVGTIPARVPGQCRTRHRCSIGGATGVGGL